MKNTEVLSIVHFTPTKQQIERKLSNYYKSYFGQHKKANKLKQRTSLTKSSPQLWFDARLLDDYGNKPSYF